MRHLKRVSYGPVFGLVFMWFAQGASVGSSELVGDWAGVMSSPRGSMEQTLTFRLEEGQLKGEISTPGGSVPVTDVDLRPDGTLSYKVTIQRGGNERVLDFSGKLVGDKLSGDYSSGGAANFSLEAERKEASPPDGNSGGLVGRWSAVAVYGGLDYRAVFYFEEEDGLKAYFVENNARKEAWNLKFEQGVLSFDFSHSEGGEVSLKATVKDGTFEGTVTGFFGEIPISAKRE